MVETVLVSGATGYIGSHVVKQCLEAGYNVRGTVRSLAPKKPEKLALLKSLQAQFPAQLTLVEADLLKPETWPEAVKGCDFVQHVASPFFLGGNDDDLIKPAVDGTLNVLKAAAESGGSVKRIVLTSSIMSVGWGHDQLCDKQWREKVFTEEDWTNVNGAKLDAYAKSKCLAERAAWDFIGSLPEGGTKPSLVVINPGFVLGPPLHATPSTSNSLICQMMTGKIAMAPRFHWQVVDVRDVAKAHVLALKSEQAGGTRNLCVSHESWMVDVGKALARMFTDQGFSKVTRGQVPNFVMWFVTFFEKSVEWREIGRQRHFSNANATKQLGMDFTRFSLDDTLRDHVNALIEVGMLDKPAQSQ